MKIDYRFENGSFLKIFDAVEHTNRTFECMNSKVHRFLPDRVVKWNKRQTDGQKDRQTDRASYRDARMHLKIDWKKEKKR